MYDAIYRCIEQVATWPWVALLFTFFLLCLWGFEWRQKKLGYGNRILDGRSRYSPKDVRQFFQAIGADGRRLYAITELTLDVLFPLIYGSLFAALILRLYEGGVARSLVLVPLVLIAADLAENVTVAIMASRFNGQDPPLAKVAVIFTVLKRLLFISSLLLIFFGAVRALLR